MNTKALRQKILDLAIHGKLVPQDPNDEPASVLLERIKAEKERLIKEGKIKRTKRSKAACDKPHYPYELPEGWEWCKLEEIVKITNGRSQKDVEDKEGLYPIYGSGGIIGKATEFLCEAGTTIIGRKGTINNPIFVKERFWNIDTAFGMKPQYAISDKYFFFFCQHFNFSELDKSTAVPSLTQSAINDIFIPIPPTNEQKRIVKEIIRCFSVVEILEKEKIDLQLTIEQTKSKILDLAIHGKLVPQDPSDEPANELLKRINHKAEITCDNPHYRNLPKGWAVIKVGNVAKYTNGRAFKPEEWESTGLPIIRIQNLNDADAPYNRSSVIHEQKYLIKDGDLLFAWAASIGTYIWSGENAWLNQHIFKVEPYPFIDKAFLFYAFQAMISEFYKNSHGSGMVHITKKQFEEITLLLPPLSEQIRIVECLEQTFSILDSINCNL